MPPVPGNTSIPHPTNFPSEKPNNLDQLLLSIVGLLLAAATLTIAFLHFQQKRGLAGTASNQPQSAPLYIIIGLCTSITDNL